MSCKVLVAHASSLVLAHRSYCISMIAGGGILCNLSPTPNLKPPRFAWSSQSTRLRVEKARPWPEAKLQLLTDALNPGEALPCAAEAFEPDWVCFSLRVHFWDGLKENQRKATCFGGSSKSRQAQLAVC